MWLQLKGPNQPAVPHECQLRDVALAILITNAGQNMKDYGFIFPPGFVPNPGQIGFGQYAFPDDAGRSAGFMKWGWKQLRDGIDGPKPDPKDGPKPDQPKDTPLPIKPGVRPLPAPAPPAVAPALPPVAQPAPAPPVAPAVLPAPPIPAPAK